MQAQGSQLPVIDIHRDRFVVVQIQEYSIVASGQGFVAKTAETLRRQLRRGSLRDGNGTLVSAAHKIEDRPQGIGVGRGQGFLRHHKVGLDEQALRGGKVGLAGYQRKGLADIVIAVLTADEGDLSRGHQSNSSFLCRIATDSTKPMPTIRVR